MAIGTLSVKESGGSFSAIIENGEEVITLTTQPQVANTVLAGPLIAEIVAGAGIGVNVSGTGVATVTVMNTGVVSLNGLNGTPTLVGSNGATVIVAGATITVSVPIGNLVWNALGGSKPTVTVSSTGTTTSTLIAETNNGADYGPDTNGTTTYGIVEACLAVSAAGGGWVYILPGTYSVNDGTHSPITLQNISNVTLVRNSAAYFILANQPSVSYFSQTNGAARCPAFLYSGCTNMTIIGGSLVQTGPVQTSGNYLNSTADWVADNCHDLDFYGASYNGFGRFAWLITGWWKDSGETVHNGGSDNIREHDNTFLACGNITVPDGGAVRVGNTGTSVSPAVPGSGTISVNTNTYTVTVNLLTGGTISSYIVTDALGAAYTVTGVRTATGNLVQLLPGWGITLNYTAVPTWAWYPTVHHIWVGERDYATQCNQFGVDVGNTTSSPITDVYIGDGFWQLAAEASPQMVGVNIEKVDVQDNTLRVHIRQPHVKGGYYGIQFGDGVGYGDVIGGIVEDTFKEPMRLNAINGAVLHDITVTGFTARNGWRSGLNGGGINTEILSGATVGSTINRCKFVNCRAIDDGAVQLMAYGFVLNNGAAGCTISNITTIGSDFSAVATQSFFVANPTGTNVGIAFDLGIKATDYRTGLTSVDAKAGTIFTVLQSGIYELSAEACITGTVTTELTYTVNYKDANGTAHTLVPMSAQSINGDYTIAPVITELRAGDAVTTQLTGTISAGTVNVSAVVTQLR